MSKRRKMALGADNMPNDVYQILNEKANSRQLTSYVVELVQEKKRYEQLMKKLDTVESKLDLLLTNGFVPKPTEQEFKVEESMLQEGKIIDAKEVIGGFAEEDNEEVDF
ncbi:hypothetical protein [Bacillus sp. BP-3]|uniref:hypothetical protein n=1 Tax=Bacillus sp. BP-3 TaxID=3022773 RepID=UPI0023302254|nr:hypothetical protein [Bacillus sp. BP-3]MDC2867327.1 hypothetical protein [Bacillus sp. BP-3]